MLAVAPSTLYGNRYYIFRDNGVEVEVELINGSPISAIMLTDEERTYFDGIIKKQTCITCRKYDHKTERCMRFRVKVVHIISPELNSCEKHKR